MRIRYLLTLYLVVYFFAAFLWRSYLVWKRTGNNPVVFKNADGAHDLIGRVFKLVFALVVAVVLVYSFWPAGYRYTVPIAWMEHVALQWAGTVLLIVSLVWTVVAQAQMGESWRIGIDHEHQTPLVHSGIYNFSRNPIFLGMMLTLFGLLLVVPNAFTLLTFGLGSVLVLVQVRLEEDFLTQLHGDEYVRYRQTVRRWF